MNFSFWMSLRCMNLSFAQSRNNMDEKKTKVTPYKQNITHPLARETNKLKLVIYRVSVKQRTHGL